MGHKRSGSRTVKPVLYARLTKEACEELQKARIRAEISQVECGRAIGLGQAAYSCKELGQNGFDEGQARALYKYLGDDSLGWLEKFGEDRRYWNLPLKAGHVTAKGESFIDVLIEGYAKELKWRYRVATSEERKVLMGGLEALLEQAPNRERPCSE